MKNTKTKTKTKPTAKAKQAKASSRKRQKQEQTTPASSKDDAKLAEETPVATFDNADHELSFAFDWPNRLVSSLCSQGVEIPKIHVRLHTEFSGAGTAEFALNALTGATNGSITTELISAADWDKVPQIALKNNLPGHTHLFSDIGHVMSPMMKERVERLVPVNILLSKADVLKAVGSSDYMGKMADSASEHNDSDHPVDWSVYSIFKKGKKRPILPTEFGGVLKARVLGTALKDYILVSEVFWIGVNNV